MQKCGRSIMLIMFLYNNNTPSLDVVMITEINKPESFNCLLLFFLTGYSLQHYEYVAPDVINCNDMLIIKVCKGFCKLLQTFASLCNIFILFYCGIYFILYHMCGRLSSRATLALFYSAQFSRATKFRNNKVA